MADRMHVLMVCVDHWPGALLGAAGHPVIQTPTLDQVARNGTRFTNAYSECPVCIPARRTMMTGTTPRTHGDRVYSDRMPMPAVPTLAGCFRNAGYQAYAVGKLHVYPQRDRIGFDDVILAEEGRYQYGAMDDYQIWLGENGYTGQEFLHGMCNNQYTTRPWHLPEEAHATTWATRQMTRMIRRRDPTRPGFFYLSYCYPHPPLVPLQCYWDLYARREVDRPYHGTWVDKPNGLLAGKRHVGAGFDDAFIRDARQAFYAQCTHIDHQLRLVIGTLREEGILGNTLILFSCDHGDMLGNHGLWAKQVFYENSANVPMLLSGPGVPHHTVDERLVGQVDIMPTLLQACGIPIPETVEGFSMLGEKRRPWLFGEIGEGVRATRMLRNDRFKLIYYPEGNLTQLFDLSVDRQELNDLAQAPESAGVMAELSQRLISQLNKGDEQWVQDGRLAGLPARDFTPGPDYALSGQRGNHWPPPLR